MILYYIFLLYDVFNLIKVKRDQLRNKYGDTDIQQTTLQDQNRTNYTYPKQTDVRFSENEFVKNMGEY